MYLTRLLNLEMKERQEMFAQIVEHHKSDLSKEGKLENFMMVYTEQAVGFEYIDKLKIMFTEYREKLAVIKTERKAFQLAEEARNAKESEALMEELDTILDEPEDKQATTGFSGETKD